MKYLVEHLQSASESRSPHGERGLKCKLDTIQTVEICRSPHGERGLKLIRRIDNVMRKVSLSSRRAWIEIIVRHGEEGTAYRRSPHGERGLK